MKEPEDIGAPRIRRALGYCGNPDCDKPGGSLWVANRVSFCSRECYELTIARQTRDENASEKLPPGMHRI